MDTLKRSNNQGLNSSLSPLKKCARKSINKKKSARTWIIWGIHYVNGLEILVNKSS